MSESVGGQAVHGRLLGKVCLVTGSSRGIGRGIALRVAREGGSVVVTYHRDPTAGGVAKAAVEAEGAKCLLLQLDVRERSAVEHAVRETVERFGSLDILVNNAGWHQEKPFEQITDEDWATAIGINLTGTFLMSQEAVRVMKPRKQGRIINITSMGGQYGGPNAPHYAAAKAAVISLTRSCARLFSSHGITVNAVSPGFIRTEIYQRMRQSGAEQSLVATIPIGRIGEPEDVAGAVCYLASEDASYITGHILNVNGGYYLG